MASASPQDEPATPQRIGVGEFCALRNPNPVYAMNRVFALPNAVAEPICTRYIPETLMVDPNLRLCRLYFGKIFASEIPRFVNTNNFPLGVRRFNILRCEHESHGLPSSEEVALEMGGMLGNSLEGRTWCAECRVHHGWLNDSLDEKVGKAVEGISTLVDAFFQNDPYYPRPRKHDSIYSAFKEGCRSSYPKTDDCLMIVGAFLTAIEDRQPLRDQRLADAESLGC